MKNNEIKRAWLLTDTHIGCKNSSIEWLEIHKNFFYNQFIPTVKENYQEGDILIHCGDVFDSRRSLDISVMNFAVQLFEDFSNIFQEVHIICGNHDIYKKNTNDVNSLKCLKWIPKVHIHEDQNKILNIQGKTVALMPWNETQEQETADLLEIGRADYLFCHTSVQNAVFSRNVKVEHANSIDIFYNFKKVYTGHIHTSQKMKNVRFLGSPYELTRNDSGNKKSFWLVDFQDDSETQFENFTSPKHLKIDFEDIERMEKEDVQNYISNNFVDITIPNDWKDTKKLETITRDIAQDNKRVKIVIREKEKEKVEQEIEVDINNINILGMAEVYLEKSTFNDGLKGKLSEYIKNLYSKCTDG